MGKKERECGPQRPVVCLCPSDASFVLYFSELEYRLDYQVRERSMENSYISLLTSHTSYWTNKDIVLFILVHLFPQLQEDSWVWATPGLHRGCEQIKDNLGLWAAPGHLGALSNTRMTWGCEHHALLVISSSCFVFVCVFLGTRHDLLKLNTNVVKMRNKWRPFCSWVMQAVYDFILVFTAFLKVTFRTSNCVIYSSLSPTVDEHSA